MNEKLFDILQTYCDREIEKFKSNELFQDLLSIVSESSYFLVCDYGKERHKSKSHNLYLSISVYNEKNEIVEIHDDGFLSASTILVLVDRKERIKFFSWDDEDFIDSVKWMIRNMKTLMQVK